MLNEQIRQILATDPDLREITPVIEKEILHHDIIDAMTSFGAMQTLTFIGGTSLRLCYNSSRLSEDLDFNGGHDFKPSQFSGLEKDIQAYIQKKYETEVWVSQPTDQVEGNTVSWKISIEKEANRPDLPRQKMHIDVCAIPSLDIQKRPLINHYNIIVPTEGVLIPVQSLEETLADKLIAFAYRSRRIKPRDIWDIVWIKQRGINLSLNLLHGKLEAREKKINDFYSAFGSQLNSLLNTAEVKQDFNQEMSRFISARLKARTLDDPDYWSYVCQEIKSLSNQILKNDIKSNKFDMS